MATTADLIRRGARQHGSRAALLAGDERLTFAETDALACRLAAVLRGRGLERVGLLVDNRLESVPLDFACVKAGIARVPLNARLAAPEMREILRTAGTRLVVTDRPVELGVETLPLDELLALARDAPRRNRRSSIAPTTRCCSSPPRARPAVSSSSGTRRGATPRSSRTSSRTSSTRAATT